MKTAEDWVTKENTKIKPAWPNKHISEWSLGSLTWSHEAEHSDEQLIEFVKQIQLDAWKQGMSDAAAIAHSGQTNRDCYCTNQIAEARDAKTTL